MKDIIAELKSNIDRQHPNPLYYQLEKQIHQMIESGVLLPGEKLPGDMEFSRKLEVGSITVRKALSRLSERGLITRTQRAGTFVAQKKEKHFPTIGFFYFLQAETMMVKRAEQLQIYLVKHNYDLKIIGFEKDYFDRENIYKEISARNLCGAIFHTVNTEACKKSLLSFEKRGFPYVRLGNPHFTGELKAPLVAGNFPKKIMDALSHLWDIGHRNIGLISSHHLNETEKLYDEFYSKHGMHPYKKWCMSIEFQGSMDEWRRFPTSQIARGYLEQNPEVTAIMVENPAACVDFLKQAMLMGKTVPDKLSLISLLDWEGLDATMPSLAAMYLSDREMAETACSLLFDIIRHGFQNEVVQEINYRLISRDSIAPPAIKMQTVR